MTASGDAAEQMVRMSLQGVEVISKLSLDGAERLVKILLAELKAPQRTKGRASLSTMLKSKKPIKVFELKDEDLKKFCQEAKKYGVMYHVLKDKDKNDGKCDIMVRAEDSSKVNRIFQRFNLGANNKATIRATLDKKRDSVKPPKERQKPEKSKAELLMEQVIAKPLQKEETQTINPMMATVEKSHPSEPSSEKTGNQPYCQDHQKRDNKNSRPSIKAQMREIEAERRKENEKSKTPKKNKNQQKGKHKNGRNR